MFARFCSQPFVSECFCLYPGPVLLTKRSKPQWAAISSPCSKWNVFMLRRAFSEINCPVISHDGAKLIQIFSLPLSGCEFAVVIVGAIWKQAR